MKGDAVTILVVDDDPDIRELMKTLLELDGYHVELAEDGIDALKQLGAGVRPALILLDLMMPRMDGEQFLKEMRATRSANIPVVIMSGTAGKASGKIGVACYLMKPFELDDLVNAVRRFAKAPRKSDAA